MQLNWTRIAASPSTGHLFSQMPQPIHASASTIGNNTSTTPPPAWVKNFCSSEIALCGSGHISSHTMQFPCSPHAMQRVWSMLAVPIFVKRFSSRDRVGIAWTGQFCPQILQVNAQYPFRGTRMGVAIPSIPDKLRSAWIA